MTFTIETAVKAPIAKVWRAFNDLADIDFEGVYTRVIPEKSLDYRMSDGRRVQVDFVERDDDVLVKETVETEDIHPYEQQRHGWQNMLDNFGRDVESQS